MPSKKYLEDEQGNIRPSMLYSIIDSIFIQQGISEVRSLFDNINAYSFPKPSIFSDKWKDGKAQEGGTGISHFIKYYTLEQYEDTLRKAEYEDSDLFENPYQVPYHQYVFLRDLKMLEALQVDLEQNRVKVDLSKLYDNIDIAETISNLRGKWIKRITADFVEFEDGETADLRNMDWRCLIIDVNSGDLPGEFG